MKLKKVISIVTAFSLSQGLVASAENLEAESSFLLDNNLEKTLNFIIKDKEMGDIVNTHKLLDVNNNVIANCWDFENAYIIFDENSVIEFSDENISPYHYTDGDAYYCGVTTYYEKQEDTFIDLMSNEVVSFDEVCSRSSSFSEQTAEVCSEIETLESEPVYETNSGSTAVVNVCLPGVTRRLAYNTQNTCGSMAAEIMLYYFYDYIDKDYVKPGLATNPRTFYNYLQQKLEPEYDMPGGYGGSNPTALATRLRTYMPYICLDKTGLKTDVEINEGHPWGYCLHLIQNEGIPTMVSISNDPVYGNHWLVCYGVYMTGPNAAKDPLTNYYVTNDGQGRLAIYINNIYSSYLVNLR